MKMTVDEIIARDMPGWVRAKAPSLPNDGPTLRSSGGQEGPIQDHDDEEEIDGLRVVFVRPGKLPKSEPKAIWVSADGIVMEQG